MGDRSLHRNPTSDNGSRRMFSAVYHQLKAVADRCMRNEPAVALQPTSLVHEAFLRMSREDVGSDQDRFLAFAAIAMRRIVIERARYMRRLKRGGDRQRVPISRVDIGGASAPLDILDLDEALDELEEINPDLCDIVMLRFLLGCTVEETARALRVSKIKIVKDWKFARAWLTTRLDPPA